MKALVLFFSILMLGSAHSNERYLRDENHDADFKKEQELERQNIHKPGQVSERNSDEQFEEKQEDVKDFDPEYDPIDDDLEEDETSREDQ
ncbi:MAG TPA: hypothetical protein VNJ08_14730 [Bacteriovoracaceae bacterium]|nr:hypothetical protein [Bacteriovoracaceae bacterium]